MQQDVAYSVIAINRSCLEEYCFPLAYTWRLMIDRIDGFKPGEFDGQTIRVSFTNPSDLKHVVVAFVACGGALSYMKIIFSCYNEISSCHYSSTFFKNSQYVTNSSRTRINEPMSSSPMTPPQIIMPPPSCCRLIAVGQLSPLKTHP